MNKQRQSNFELLRILLMIAVPLYHMIIYAGIIYMPYGNMTAEALWFCSGSAIVADYAFMAMSSYFFLNSKGKNIISRFLMLGVQVLVLYALKVFVIRKVLGFPEEDYFVEDFFIKGAWWFIYAYLIILLIHPLLNKIIYQLKDTYLLLICILLGCYFVWNGLRNDVNLFHDLFAFLFTYFVIGYLKRVDFQRYFGMPNKKSVMVTIYLVGTLSTFFFLWWAKYPGNMPSDAIASDIVRCVVGKYSFLQFVMGIAIFLLFRSIKMNSNIIINALAENVFFVFLLHETVMAIYWYFGKMRTIDDVLPYSNLLELLVWAVIYVGSSFAFAILIRFLYNLLLKKPSQKLVSMIGNTDLVMKLESCYKKLEV